MYRLSTTVSDQSRRHRERLAPTFLVFETAATEVDDLDGALGGVAEEYILKDESALLHKGDHEIHTSGLRSQWTMRCWRIRDKALASG